MLGVDNICMKESGHDEEDINNGDDGEKKKMDKGVKVIFTLSLKREKAAVTAHILLAPSLTVFWDTSLPLCLKIQAC